MKKKKGFTLVELLAVIVVLAIILVIAVPKILDVIKSSRENSLISSAKLIARNAEQKRLANEVLGEDENFDCSDVADINTNDYASCTVTFDSNGNAVVNITGSGKFKDMNVCNATKNDARIYGNGCVLTCNENETKTLVGYKMKSSYSKDECVNKFIDIFNEIGEYKSYKSPNTWPEEIYNAELDDLFYSDAYLICNNALDGVYSNAYSDASDAFDYTLGISSVDEYITFLISNGQVEYDDVKDYVVEDYDCILNCPSDMVLNNNRCVYTNVLSNEWFTKADFTKEDVTSHQYHQVNNYSIESINFYSDGRNFDGESVDVSEREDGSIKLYFDDETGTVNFVSNKIISFPEDSSNLFGDLVNLENINFNHSIDTSNVLKMEKMFSRLVNLNMIDLSEFTFNSNVNPSGLFFDEPCSMFEMEYYLIYNKKIVWPEDKFNLWKNISMDLGYSNCIFMIGVC